VYALALGLALVMPILQRVQGVLPTNAAAESGYRVSDNYKTDAYGVELATSGVTSNVYRFAGEQFDIDLNLEFLRSRYLKFNTGRFHTRDRFEAGTEETFDLNKYAYARSSPESFSDPSGKQASLAELATVGGVLGAISGHVNYTSGLRRSGAAYSFTDDILSQAYLGTIGAFGLPLLAQIAGGLSLTGGIGFVAPAAKAAEVDWQKMNFSQTTASRFFSDTGRFAGETIGSLADLLKSGKANVDEVPVQYIVRNGNYLIVNTRSYLALLRSGLDRAAIRFIDISGDSQAEIAMTERLARNKLTDIGTAVIRITGPVLNASSLE